MSFSVSDEISDMLRDVMEVRGFSIAMICGNVYSQLAAFGMCVACYVWNYDSELINLQMTAIKL